MHPHAAGHFNVDEPLMRALAKPSPHGFGHAESIYGLESGKPAEK